MLQNVSFPPSPSLNGPNSLCCDLIMWKIKFVKLSLSLQLCEHCFSERIIPLFLKSLRIAQRYSNYFWYKFFEVILTESPRAEAKKCHLLMGDMEKHFSQNFAQKFCLHWTSIDRYISYVWRKTEIQPFPARKFFERQESSNLSSSCRR